MGNLDAYQDVKEQNLPFERVKSLLNYFPSFKFFPIYSFICFYLFLYSFIEQILPVLVRFRVTLGLKMTCSFHISK